MPGSNTTTAAGTLAGILSGSERRGFIANAAGHRLFYAVHGADARAHARTGGAWIFCNPFFEEKIFSHRAYVALARALAARGHLVMRFDYRGDGNSEGEFAPSGLADWQRDVQAAAAFLRNEYAMQADELQLFGLRAGALVAAAAAPLVGARGLLLWEPVLDGAAYLQDCLRANLTTQLSSFQKVLETREQLMARLQDGGLVNVMGHDISASTAQSLKSLQLRALLEQADLPARALRFVRGESAKLPEAWVQLAEAPHLRVAACRAHHLWNEGKWYDDQPQELIAASVSLAEELCELSDEAAAPAGPP